MQNLNVGTANIVFDLPLWQVIQLIAGVLLPLAVRFITHHLADEGLKATWLLGLSATTSLLTELAGALQSGTTYNLGTALVFALITFVTGVGALYGFYKPHGVDESVGTRGFSIGQQRSARLQRTQ